MEHSNLPWLVNACVTVRKVRRVATMRFIIGMVVSDTKHFGTMCVCERVGVNEIRLDIYIYGMNMSNIAVQW